MNVPYYSITVGVVTGVGSAMIQAASPTVISLGDLGFTIPIVAALISAAVSYGMLRGTVKAIERDISLLRNEVTKDFGHMREDVGHIYNLVRDTTSRMAHIEGRLEGE
jgi:hypothetical protein